MVAGLGSTHYGECKKVSSLLVVCGSAELNSPEIPKSAVLANQSIHTHTHTHTHTHIYVTISMSVVSKATYNKYICPKGI